MDIKQLLGNRIRQLRIINCLTQENLAEKVSIAPKYQSRIETGKTFVSSNLIERYAQVFNISPVEIFTFQTEISRNELIKRITENLEKLPDKDIKIIYNIMDALRLKG